ncbi:Uncharacterized protein APZ42_000186 [Daphnia magna]|uniref:Uncharacterized protein n=1 Tax=Daphnia magna TaxID=35525 RepID=A0A164JUX4_9CRUS|nr:Uncharacterized protein APZ42_000186 [Daphnia magna]
MKTLYLLFAWRHVYIVTVTVTQRISFFSGNTYPFAQISTHWTRGRALVRRTKKIELTTLELSTLTFGLVSSWKHFLLKILNIVLFTECVDVGLRFIWSVDNETTDYQVKDRDGPHKAEKQWGWKCSVLPMVARETFWEL